MSILCIVLAIALGLAIKELRNKAKDLEMYEGMSDHYYEKSNYLEEQNESLNEEIEFLNRHMEVIKKFNENEVSELNDYIECLQKQCNEYATEHLTALANMVSEVTDTPIGMYKEVNEEPVFEENIALYLGFEDEDKDFGDCIGWGEFEGRNVAVIGINTVEHYGEQDIWMIDYLNKEFGVNLVPNAKTMHTLSFLHEFGHYVDSMNYEDINNFHNADKEQYNKLHDMNYGEERWLAYRKVPAEAFADKWAIEFMIKHFPELV
jgi:DNA repair exonuclease SbcCD ATPase subunit